jgi:Tfp pilus assembly protein PilZ
MSTHVAKKNFERRDNVRIDQVSALKVKNLKSGKIHNARMFNFSKNGLYFESDSVLHTGDHIYIGIQDSPYASSSGVLEYYRAEIRWHKRLKDSYFDYGYGVELNNADDKQSKKSIESKDHIKAEKNQKKPDRKTIKFADKNKTYEGSIKDISASGVFFVAEETLVEGQMLTFELSLKNGDKAQINGQVVWSDNQGFGAIFTDSGDLTG